MSKSFDEWYVGTNNGTAKDAYKAGAESRQAEIDELNNEFETMRGMHESVSLYADELINERDELQKRIDDALGELIVYENISVARKILKGEQNDN